MLSQKVLEKTVEPFEDYLSDKLEGQLQFMSNGVSGSDISNQKRDKMDDSEDWGVEDDDKKEEEKAAEVPQKEVEQGRKKGRGQKEQVVVQDGKSDEKQEYITEEKQESGKVSKISASVQQAPAEKVRVASLEKDISEVVNPNATQLQISKANNSSWLDDNKVQEAKKQEPSERRRGNRGNRGRNEEQNNQNNQQDAPKRRGNRGEEDRGDRNDRGEDRGGYRGYRGGYNRGGDRGDEREYRPPRRDFNQDGGDNRGGFRGGYRGRGGFNRDNREGGEDRRGDREGGNFHNRNNQEGRDFNQNRGNRDGGDRNGRYPNNQGQSNKNQVLIPPQVRRSWPACQIFIMGRRLSITLRKVQDFKSKILVVPFRNLKFDYYPGNYILTRPFSYKQKLQAKEQKAKLDAGQVYFQKAVSIPNYEAIAFIKIEDTNVEESLNKGIQYILKHVGSLKVQAKFDSLVFPMCEELCEPQVLIAICSKHLQQYKQVKELSLATKDPAYFNKCIQEYQKYITETVNKNELCLE